MQNLYLFLSTMLAYFVKGITGFGNTLVMGSLFSFAVSNRLTTPLDLLFSIPTNTFIAWRERKNISLKVVIPLSLMLLAGILPGTFLLKTGNDRILKAGLGIVIVGIAIEMFTRKPNTDTSRKSNPVFLAAIGIISGILAGLYGIGALLITYISRTTSNKNQFRGDICCVFLVENLFRFFLYLYTGILNMEVLRFALLLAPAVLIGMFIGIKADSRMNEETVRKSTIVMLILSGLTLFIRNVLSH
jgi:uncharacterized membrane protein YfcA